MIELNFYALRYDPNQKKVVSFNIFGNQYVYDVAIKAVVRYMTGATDYSGYVEAIKRGISHEMWCRVQYEISVNDAFPRSLEESEKIDVFSQVEKNLDVIAQYVYMQAKTYFYNEDVMNEWSKPNELRDSIWVDEVKEKVFYSQESAIAAIDEIDLEEADGDKDKYIRYYIKEYLKNE